MIKELCSSLGKCSSGTLLSAGLPVCRIVVWGYCHSGQGGSRTFLKEPQLVLPAVPAYRMMAESAVTWQTRMRAGDLATTAFDDWRVLDGDPGWVTCAARGKWNGGTAGT